MHDDYKGTVLLFSYRSKCPDPSGGDSGAKITKPNLSLNIVIVVLINIFIVIIIISQLFVPFFKHPYSFPWMTK